MKKTISLGIILLLIIATLFTFQFSLCDDEHGFSHISTEADQCCISIPVPILLAPVAQRITPSHSFSLLINHIPVVIQPLVILLPMTYGTGRDSPSPHLSLFTETQGLRAPPQ